MRISIFFVFLSVASFACVAQNNSGYTLVWSDEFAVSGAINSNLWFHQVQLPAGGSWYNGELQHYTNRAINSNVANGSLRIVARKENFTDQGHTKQYTSARLNSKFAFTYGRVDARAKLPAGAGTWPAIWTLGQNINEPGGFFSNQFGTVNWPACGEIDIMEHWGNNPNVIHGSLHTPSSFGSTINTKTKVVQDVSNTFHVYSIIWDENKIEFLIDDVSFYTYSPAVKNSSTWPFDKPQYLLLNIAMGGVGGPIDPAFTESSMEVDYVRVYQKGVSPSTRNQSIVFPPIGDKTVGDAAFQLTATASSNLPVTYTTNIDNLTISGSTVTIMRPGRAAITARQSGNTSFNAAPDVTQLFCVKPFPPSITVVESNATMMTLVSNATTGNQWFLNGVAIPSASNATLSVSTPGVYKVQVTIDACSSEFSADVPFFVTGDLPSDPVAVAIYPNPVENVLTLIGIKDEPSNVRLMDFAGKPLTIEFEKRDEVFQSDFKQLTSGVYLLDLQDGTTIHRFKVVKR